MSDEMVEVLKTKWARDFIISHEEADVHHLTLNPPAETKPHITLLIDQIISRRKAKVKFPFWYNHKELLLPPPLSLEQSSSEATSNYKSNLIEGERLLDLTGGMGVDCLAFADKFHETHYVEQSEVLCEVFEYNIQVLNRSVSIHHTNAHDFVSQLDDDFVKRSWFFVDPARRGASNQKVFRLQDCEPNVNSLVPEILKRGGRVLIKTSPMLDINQGLKALPQTTSIHVVAVKNEVKELLFVINEYNSETEIHAINLGSSHQEFVFKQEEEKDSITKYSGIKQYLYEPNVAVLKAGAFKLVGKKFDLGKLDPHTHLYTNDKLESSFPGRVFEVQSVLDKASIKRLAKAGPYLIISRNHPLSVAQIRSKYKLADGGSEYLIACRIMGKPNIIHCHLLN